MSSGFIRWFKGAPKYSCMYIKGLHLNRIAYDKGAPKYSCMYIKGLHLNRITYDKGAPKYSCMYIKGLHLNRIAYDDLQNIFVDYVNYSYIYQNTVIIQIVQNTVKTYIFLYTRIDVGDVNSY